MMKEIDENKCEQSRNSGHFDLISSFMSLSYSEEVLYAFKLPQWNFWKKEWRVKFNTFLNVSSQFLFSVYFSSQFVLSSTLWLC